MLRPHSIAYCYFDTAYIFDVLINKQKITIFSKHSVYVKTPVAPRNTTRLRKLLMYKRPDVCTCIDVRTRCVHFSLDVKRQRQRLRKVVLSETEDAVDERVSIL